MGTAGGVIFGGNATKCWVPRCHLCQWKCVMSPVLAEMPRCHLCQGNCVMSGILCFLPLFRLLPKTSGVQKEHEWLG